jgi:hypothetical protein
LLASPKELEDESDDESAGSGSDFSQGRTAQLAKRQKLLSRGRDVSDTEDEDQEAEDEMMDDVVPESPARCGASARRPKTYGRSKASPKGPRRDAVEEGEGDEDDADGGKSRYVTGPLSKEPLQEIQELASRTQKDAEALALKYRKSVRSIMIAAGLSIHQSRRDNFSNKFKIWYSHVHPKPGSKFS